VWRILLVLALALNLMLTRRLLTATAGGGSFTNPLAYATLTRYGTSPVLARGGVGTWDHDTIAGEAPPFFDSRTHKWVMVYSALDKPIASGGIAKVGLAYSPDLLNWTKEAANPVYTAPGGDVMTATSNVVQVSDSSYRLYSQVYPASNAFALATSADMLTWTDQGHVFGLGTTGQWDDNAIFDPDPVLIGTTTYLWYGGQKSDATRGIGLATAPSPGTTFTRQGELFSPAAGESQASYGAPAAIVTDATHYSIFHDAALSGSSTTRFIDREDTTDGVTFTHHQAVFSANPSGWDSVQVFDSAPVVVSGVLYLFYAGSAIAGGSTGLSPDIGLATMRWP
jgi:predicted GH43/DUF377 family glycosyl hydrolase